MSFVHSPKIVTDGLVLSLDAGNVKSYPGSGTVWTDKSGFVNNGTLVNGVGYTSSFNGSLVFDGTNDYVTVLNNPVLSTMSVSVWVRIQTVTANKYIFNKLPTVGNNSNYGLNIHSGGQTLNISSYNGSTSSEFNSSYKPVVNTWFNVVALYNSSSSAIYINNNLNTSGYIAPVNSGTRIDIGANPLGILYPINADIATFQVYNKVLSQAEITQNFNALRGRFGI
jgi:hypothetical protein